MNQLGRVSNPPLLFVLLLETAEQPYPTATGFIASTRAINSSNCAA